MPKLDIPITDAINIFLCWLQIFQIEYLFSSLILLFFLSFVYDYIVFFFFFFFFWLFNHTQFLDLSTFSICIITLSFHWNWYHLLFTKFINSLFAKILMENFFYYFLLLTSIRPKQRMMLSKKIIVLTDTYIYIHLYIYIWLYIFDTL